VTIGFLNAMFGEVLEVITTIEIFHVNHMIPTITFVPERQSHAIDKIQFNPFTK
jgi:hypothetical protein